ncbi:MAG TPA: glycosyltransferase family 4 protein [Rhizomicrobium sp.]|jgi:glycosyltransferase involved in cell wall biosynthesis|nr:glycosyltransferase family 4 protein [Rhizomicrobium sp.]
MDSRRRLHLLLAPKERFEAGGAGAFALNALETTLASRWRNGITVFGTPVARPFPSVSFQPVALPRWPLRGRNIEMARRYVSAVRRAPPDIVEVFNRPVMMDYLRRRLATAVLILHFGNDPRGMDGSRSIAQRRKLLAQCDAIVCVSDFIRRCFLDGIDDPLAHRATVIHTGVHTPAAFPEGKEKTVAFVGRITPDKGALELVQALARLLPRHPDWTAEIIGARWFKAGEPPDSYEKEVAHAGGECARIRLGGFRQHEDVIAALEKASIAVVPSKWDDPFPRTALEALAAGCALICSRQGGLPEIGTDRAVFLNDVTADSIAAALDNLLSNENGRVALQHRGFDDSPFDIRRTTSRLDDLRESLMAASRLGIRSSPDYL